MATGSPVSFWYGTRAQFDSITTKLDTTLYFITDEQALYKGTVKFSGSGVDTLLTISATEPTASSVTTGDKYFNTTDNLIHVLLNDNGTVSTTATYEPANGALYYNADAQRFQTLIKDGSSYIPTEIYDAGISVEDGTGLVLNGTTVGGLDATANSKGVVQVGSNLNVSDGIVSVPTATNARFGVVKSGDNITSINGVLSVAKATASSLGVVKPGDNINVDNNGQISVPVANGNTKGVVSAGANVNNNNGVLSVSTASTGSQGVIKIADPFSCDSSGILKIADASATNKGVVKVGTNIDVADGVISVKDASTSDKGVVQLTSSLDDIYSNTLAATPALVNTITADLDGRKQDNISCETPINLDVNRISLAYGDGLAVGVSGTTNANKLITNEASVKEVLEDVVDGGTEPAVNEIVTADNLRGALSVGQAVDVSCAPRSISGGTITPDVNGGFLSGVTWVTNAGASFSAMGYAFDNFPKFADGLSYLWIFDIENQGSNSANISKSENCTAISGTWIDWVGARTLAAGDTKRVAVTFNVARPHIDCSTGGATLRMTNYRIYEVTALTDEAIAYLAQLPDPDAFFRSTSAYSIRNKYLIKQDMVCPFIPTIEMSNSDLTVAAGLSYKMTYKSNTATTYNITADTIPTLAYGWDTHLQLFVDDKTTVNFQSPLVLQDPLTPNAGHNMTIKWRNGQALAYVDDTDVGYIVTVTAGTENGSLYYGLTNDVGEYITFANTTDGTAITIPDVVYNYDGRTINILGNGSDKTIIDLENSHGFYVVSEKVSHATIQGLTVRNSNTLHGGFVDLIWDSSTCDIANCIITGNTASHGAVFYAESRTKSTIKNCVITGNTCTSAGGAAINLGGTAMLTVENTVFSDNVTLNRFGSVMYTQTDTTVSFSGCTFSNNTGDTGSYASLMVTTAFFTDCKFLTTTDTIRGGTITFAGTNVINSTVKGGTGQKVHLLATSNLDLSENSTSKVIIGGTITAQSGAQVIPYGETESVAVEGSGNTLLNNGKLGFLVSVASGTGSNTLYDALVGGGTPYSNVIFDPALDEQTITLATDTQRVKPVRLIGNGTDKTRLSLKYLQFYQSGSFFVDDCTMTYTNTDSGADGFVTYIINGAKCTFTNVTISGSSCSRYVLNGSNKLMGCVISDNSSNNAISYVRYPSNFAINTLFKDNQAPNGVLCINTSDDSSSALPITGCTFSGNSSYAIKWYSNTVPSRVTVSDCKFMTTTDNISVGTAGTLTFSGTNIINSTVSGEGTVAFADGATVTSTIPSGSTIGTGVISALLETSSTFTLENLTLTGITSTSDSGLIVRANGDDITLKNCVIEGNTISNYAIYSAPNATSGKLVLDNVTVRSNTGSIGTLCNNIYPYTGKCFVNNVTCTTLIPYQSVIIISGDNTFAFDSATPSTSNAKVIFTPGSIVRMSKNSTSLAGNSMFYVGTYDEDTGTITTTGTATVVLNGTSVSISGSGNIIDNTGLHS